MSDDGPPEADPWDGDLTDVVDTLRRFAQKELAERRQPAPQATSLVDRAFLRLLSGPQRFQPRDTEHLRRTAARAIRFALRDALRAENTAKRGGHLHRIAVQDLGGAAEEQTDETEFLDALIDELDAFAEKSPEAISIVEHLFVLGASPAQTVRDLGVRPEEVKAAEILFRDFCAKRHRK